MKYLVTKKVHSFRYKNKSYRSGSEVEIPEGENVPAFLEPVELKRVTKPTVEELAPDYTTGANPASYDSSAPKAELSADLSALDEPPKRRARKVA